MHLHASRQQSTRPQPSRFHVKSTSFFEPDQSIPILASAQSRRRIDNEQQQWSPHTVPITPRLRIPTRWQSSPRHPRHFFLPSASHTQNRRPSPVDPQPPEWRNARPSSCPTIKESAAPRSPLSCSEAGASLRRAATPTSLDERARHRRHQRAQDGVVVEPLCFLLAGDCRASTARIHLRALAATTQGL